MFLMSIHIDPNNVLHHAQGTGFALHCPCCQVFAHLTASSVPQFAELNAARPTQVGIVYRCDSCNAPVFIKYQVKQYTPEGIDLADNYVELERVRERFPLTYLPESCEQLFREALNCYSNNCLAAFGLLCRSITQVLFKDLGDSGRIKVLELLVEIRDIAALDAERFAFIKRTLFDRDSDSGKSPLMNAQQAGILLEVMKDLLYQVYVRSGKLRKAVMVRGFFASERANHHAVTATGHGDEG